MSENRSSYTDTEFRKAQRPISKMLVAPKALAPQENPQAFLLGGQSGAGKTTLHEILKRRLRNNVIVINGDEYRSAHPRYRELDREFGIDSVRYTAPWAGAMTEALIDSLSKAHCNLIVEGTLRTVETPAKTAALLKSRGYSVSLALMAVKPEISLISCQIRYEEMRIAGTIPRATDPAHHAKIIEAVVGNIAELEKANLFDAIELYDRSEKRLFSNKDDHGGASDAMREILFGEWTSEERDHYEQLQGRLEALKLIGAQ